MIKRFLTAGIIAVLFLGITPSWSRTGSRPSHELNPLIEIMRHEQNQQKLGKVSRVGLESVPAVLPDAGQIAVIDDSDGVVVPAGFDLDQRTVEFQPVGSNASQYSYAAAASRFDAGAGAGMPVQLADDAATEAPLPFSFPFYGLRYSSVFIHSDGNLTFGQAEASSDPRDFVRLVVGPPRIAALFIDLDPSQPNASISYVSTPTRFLVTWSSVPLYADTPGPTVPRETFQAALFPDGRVEISYRGVSITQTAVGEGQPLAVVGLAPGGATRIEQVTFVDLTSPSQQNYSNAIVEEFASVPQFDRVSLGKKFYRNHDDAYDFLVVFSSGSQALSDCADALRIRNWTRGIGERVLGLTEEFDLSREFGSAGRLQTIIYMGPISRYPDDPLQVRPLGGSCPPGSVANYLGQEAGHRFLAYPRFVDPATGQTSSELLGRDLAHWSFYLNTDASYGEGNQIEDKGPGAAPRFETKEINQRYSALDQYLMGLRAPEDVPPTFLVRQPSIDFPRSHEPQSGLFFDGTRVEITVPMIVAAEGRRLPDHTVSPKRFRFAFALLAPAGTTASAAELTKIERYRSEWETIFGRATGSRGQADTRLAKQLQLSLWPAAGLIQGRTVTASVMLASPAGSAVTVTLSSSGAQATVPGSVIIPAGQQAADFPITGNSPGVAEITARVDDSYDTARAFVQVRSDASGLRVEQLWTLALSLGLYLPAPDIGPSGGAGNPLGEEVIFRVRDENFVPYPGLRLNAAPSGSGAVSPALLMTDSRGWVRLNWKLDTAPGLNTLTVSLDGQPQVSARAQSVGTPQPTRRRDPRLPLAAIP